MFGTKTTDDLTEGTTNLYDNSTWNETRANTLYSSSGGATFVGTNYSTNINDSNFHVTNATYEEINTTSNIEGLGFNITDDLTAFYDDRYLAGQLSLYFWNTSDLFNSSYTVMNTTLHTGIIGIDEFTALPAGDTLLAKRILSTLQLSVLETGAYKQHTTINYTAGTKNVQLKSTLYILFVNGTETTLGASTTSAVLTPGAYQQVIWAGTIDSDIVFSAGDYLTMYLNATVSGGGSAPTLELIVGDSTSARLDVGVNPTDVAVSAEGNFVGTNYSDNINRSNIGTFGYYNSTLTNSTEFEDQFGNLGIAYSWLVTTIQNIAGNLTIFPSHENVASNDSLQRHDQDLNTTDYVTFANVSVSNITNNDFLCNATGICFTLTQLNTGGGGNTTDEIFGVVDNSTFAKIGVENTGTLNITGDIISESNIGINQSSAFCLIDDCTSNITNNGTHSIWN